MITEVGAGGGDSHNVIAKSEAAAEWKLSVVGESRRGVCCKV